MNGRRLLLFALLGACGSGPSKNQWVPPPPPLHQAEVQASGVTPGDADGDGILDVDDKCPRDPEVKNGFEDDDGCPDRACTFVRQIVECTNNDISFAANRFSPDKDGGKLLDGLAALLVAMPDVGLVELRGYRTLKEAPRLALQRSEAVQAALVKRGVESPRLAIIDGGIAETARVEMEITRQKTAYEQADELVCTPAGRIYVKLTSEEKQARCKPPG